METMTENNDCDSIETIVNEAHEICDVLLLFEASYMEENEIRLFLEGNNVTDREIQDNYIELVRTYDRETGGRSS
jgi:hypothetical protein